MMKMRRSGTAAEWAEMRGHVTVVGSADAGHQRYEIGYREDKRGGPVFGSTVTVSGGLDWRGRPEAATIGIGGIGAHGAEFARARAFLYRLAADVAEAIDGGASLPDIAREFFSDALVRQSPNNPDVFFMGNTSAAAAERAE